MPTGYDPPTSLPAHILNLPSWYSSVILSDQGKIRAISLNARIALAQDQALADKIRYDRFRDQPMVVGSLPWSPHYSGPRPWEGSDHTQATWWLQN